IPSSKLNASFGGTTARSGKIAFVTQSGAMATAIVDWATSRGIGFSQILSLGDMADVDFGDTLDLLASDDDSAAILLYIEAITFPRKFMSAARAAARAKPVIVVKAGRFKEGARAATSHTGALAGSDDVYSAAFLRAGCLRVFELEELFDAAETLSKINVPSGERLAILTNGGGAGVLATDSLIEQGGTLAKLSNQTMERLNTFLPPTWSHANPIDIIGDASAERYAKSLEALLTDPGVDAVLTLNCPTAVVDSSDVAKEVIKVNRPEGKSVLTVWLGGENQEKARRVFTEAGMPCFATPGSGVRAFMHLIRFKHGQEALMATPPSIPEDFHPDVEKAKTVFESALREGREWLSEFEAKQVLTAYEIPTTKNRLALNTNEAENIAKDFGGSVALKVHSPDIIHKSDVGGVALDLKSPEEVKNAALSMIERIKRKMPQASLKGFIVEEMVSRPGALELIIGMKEDSQFGPVIMFGEGGTAVEVIGDTTLELPPLDLKLAGSMIERTRISKRLKGYRDQPSANLKALQLTIMKVSQLIIDFGEIAEIDINPLIADAQGVLALDARIRLKASNVPSHQRLAIKPYPKELEEEVQLEDGRKFRLRPIRGEDEPALVRAFGRPTPEEVRRHFNVPSKIMTHLMAARFTHINYDREMALILTDGHPPISEIFAIAGLATDPDGISAEYAVVVRPELSGKHVGRLLLEKLIRYAKSRGIRELTGDVLSENGPMLKLCADLGFNIEEGPKSSGIVKTKLILAGKTT
ncbi:MAG: bifunctional acetate--CoA ligase family protein/GNAT family N-acetyltransferase, partial [Bdellovibrionales bacterium]